MIEEFLERKPVINILFVRVSSAVTVHLNDGPVHLQHDWMECNPGVTHLHRIPDGICLQLLITICARSEIRNVLARSNTGVMGSNPTLGMDVDLRLFCLCCLV
jgi:hypothetical protein